MLHLTVAQDGSGDYASVSEAVLAVPYELEAEIVIGPGVYREKLVCEKRCITLRGAGADQTILVWADGGKLPHPDGRPTHTFRSYTAFFSGESLTVEDLTIANDAGPGSLVGQAIAAYVDSARAVFRRVKLLGNQDTLFCAPLPEKEREKDGFLGPRTFAPRRASAQYYQNCEIAGDIDFIFGGADALFEQCTLRTVNNHIPRSFVTAPSGPADGLGFVFWDCDLVSDCPAGTVYLGRPWRPRYPHCPRRLLALERPHRHRPCLLCGGGQFRRRGCAPPGLGERTLRCRCGRAAGPRPEALPPGSLRKKERHDEKAPQRRQMAHHSGRSGPHGLDAGPGQRPRLPCQDARPGQQPGHLPFCRLVTKNPALLRRIFCYSEVMMNQNVVPLPTVLCTPKRKPCCWKMAFVMDRPRPVPCLPASERER